VLTKYNSTTLGTSITIPNVIDGHLISGLGDQVFMDRKELKEVNFSEGLRTIGAKAFANCENLEKIGNFPKTLRYIGDYAFYDCSKLTTNIEFTDNMQSVGTQAFYGCSNITGTITNLLRTNVIYGQNVFSGCSKITGDIGEAMSVLIKSTDTKIPDNLFSGMTGLTGTVTIGSNIEEIGEYAFYYCTGITGLNINNAINLATIGDYAFSNCSNMSCELNFKSAMKTIGMRAFESCKISNINIPKTVENIGYWAFFRVDGTTVNLNCGDIFESGPFISSKFTTLTFGSDCTMTYIPNSMFSGGELIGNIIFPSTITEINVYAFSGNKNITYVEFDNNLKYIRKYAFSGCEKLTSIPIDSEKSLIEIEGNAFSGCTNLGKKIDAKTNLISLLENSNVTTIGENAFENCSYLEGTYYAGLTNKVVDEDGNHTIVISVGTNAFNGTSIIYSKVFELINSKKILANEFENVSEFTDSSKNKITEITIPSTVETIEASAFANCSSITKITIPDSVTSIDESAFAYCTSLTTVINNSKCTIIPSKMFYGCTALTSISSLEKIEEIQASAFENCTALASVTFGTKLNTLGNRAFYGSGLTSIKFPNSLTTIGSNVFYCCTKLTSVDLTDYSLDNIAYGMFGGCKLLASINLKDDITKIGTMAFEECKALSSIDLKNIKTIGSSAFKNCALTSVRISNDVTKIDEYTFYGNTSLTSVYGCENVTSLGKYAFYGCSNLETVERINKYY
jgi:hypothetical protein